MIDTTQPWDNDDVARSMEDSVEEQVEIVLPPCELGKLKDIVSSFLVVNICTLSFVYVCCMCSSTVLILSVCAREKALPFVSSKKGIFRSC